MIYQLRQDIENNFPGENIFANLINKIDPELILPDRLVQLREETGIVQPRTGYTTKRLQVICRDIDPVKARKLALDIFKYLNDKYSITLPSVTVDGDVYPEVFILQISADAEPQILGEDEEGRPEFTTNFRIIYRRT
jgi:hypothetical protein